MEPSKSYSHGSQSSGKEEVRNLPQLGPCHVDLVHDDKVAETRPAYIIDTIMLYHERQQLQHCCVHTINNLFQQHVFSAADLDALCAQLAPGSLSVLNPHRTFLLGNYDINVLEVALKQQGKELCWYDLRDTHFKHLSVEECWAIIVNVKGLGYLSRLLRGRHWLGLRCLDGHWYNLDSHLPQPQLVDCHGLGEAEAVRQFLVEQVHQRDGKVFLVKEQAAAGEHASAQLGDWKSGAPHVHLFRVGAVQVVEAQLEAGRGRCSFRRTKQAALLSWHGTNAVDPGTYKFRFWWHIVQRGCVKLRSLSVACKGMLNGTCLTCGTPEIL